MLSALGDALKVTVFGMAIVFVMLIIIILAVKFIEPVRRFFAGLFIIQIPSLLIYCKFIVKITIH